MSDHAPRTPIERIVVGVLDVCLGVAPDIDVRIVPGSVTMAVSPFEASLLRLIRVALSCGPDLTSAPATAPALAAPAPKGDLRDHLLPLARLWAAHDGVSHWAISHRLTGKGDFFHRLEKGQTCRLPTARRVLALMAQRWPADLPWPADIPRPLAQDAAP